MDIRSTRCPCFENIGALATLSSHLNCNKALLSELDLPTLRSLRKRNGRLLRWSAGPHVIFLFCAFSSHPRARQQNILLAATQDENDLRVPIMALPLTASLLSLSLFPSLVSCSGSQTTLIDTKPLPSGSRAPPLSSFFNSFLYLH